MNEIKKQKSFDTLLFKDELDFKIFEDILDTLDHIKPIKISRKEYNEKKGNILVEIGEDKIGKLYNLFLPSDIKIYELPAIISRVNKLTFGENLPIYTSKNELRINILICIGELFKRLDKDTNRDKDLQRSIKKYMKLYEDMFGNNDLEKLSDPNYINTEIQTTSEQSNYERFYNYQTKLAKIQTKESLNELMDEIEESLSNEIHNHFYESFLENGTNMIRKGLTTITQQQQSMIEKKEGDIIKTHKKDTDLDKEERLLRDKIGIEKLKNILTNVRKKGDKKEIEKFELIAADKIIEALYDYPYQFTSENEGYKPNKIIINKKVYCVGFSIIGHSFLSELGIKHKVYNSLTHSAIFVIIGDQYYLMDATSKRNILRLGKVNADTEIISTNNNNNEKELANAEEVESGILSQIINNKGGEYAKKEQFTEALRIYDLSIDLNPRNSASLTNKAMILWRIGKNEEAFETINKASKVDDVSDDIFKKKQMIKSSLTLLSSPEKEEANKYIEKGNEYYNTGEFTSAIIEYDKAIRLNPLTSIPYYNKGVCLNKLGDKYSAINHYKKALSINPEDKDSYSELRKTFGDIGKSKLANLYRYIFTNIVGKPDGLEILYSKEKKKINKFLKHHNYEGLRDYLISLEK